LAIETEDHKYIYIAWFQNVSEEKFQVKLHVYKQMSDEFKKVTSYYQRQENENITPRQQEVMKLIINGLSNKEITSQLNIN